MRRYLGVLMLALGLALAGCEANDDAEPRRKPPERVSISELEPCGKFPEVEGFRCGSIEVPFERSDPSYGKTEIGFAVRPRDQRDKPSLGAIFAQEAAPGTRAPGPRTRTRSCSPTCSSAASWSWSTCAGSGSRTRSTVPTSSAASGPTRSRCPSAPAGSASASSPTAPLPPRMT